MTKILSCDCQAAWNVPSEEEFPIFNVREA